MSAKCIGFLVMVSIITWGEYFDSYKCITVSNIHPVKPSHTIVFVNLCSQTSSKGLLKVFISLCFASYLFLASTSNSL